MPGRIHARLVATPLSELRVLEAWLRRIADAARLLPALTGEAMAQERARLLEAARGGEFLEPRWTLAQERVPHDIWRTLELALPLAEEVPFAELYLSRLHELELELCLIDALGDPRRVRPLSARRFGTGREPLPGVEASAGPGVGEGGPRLVDLASRILARVPHEEEPRSVAPMGEGDSLEVWMRRAAAHAGLTLGVRYEPHLVAGAAAGERSVFIGERRFGPREAARLAVHEVLGHAVAASNARDQPIRLYSVGSAGSFTDQEGLCLALEEQAGLLDAYRLRVLAARVAVTERMHAGAAFSETARWLHREHGFTPEDAIAMAERAYRGGGVARDVGYLRGWLRVRSALEEGRATLDALRLGRVDLGLVERAPRLREAGLLRGPRLRPRLAHPELEAWIAPHRASAVAHLDALLEELSAPPER